MRHLACLALVLASLVAGSARADEVLRITTPDAATRQQLGLMFGHIAITAEGDALVEADALTRDRLDRAGIAWQRDEAASAALAGEQAAFAGDRSITGYACYRTVEETLATIDALVAARPDLAGYVDIGDSWRRQQNPAEGWPLRVLRLTNSAVAGDKPRMFAMSAVHAREYTTAELMTRFAERLVAGHGTDAEATWLLDHNEFHLLLHANPDGRKRAETGILWRKNENTIDGGCGTNPPTSSSHPGIDLNRNFPLRWSSTPGGSSGVPCEATYRGPAAASEPETQAIVDYVLTLFPDTRPGSPTSLTTPADEAATRGLFFDIHSYSKLVLWPWGTTTQTTGNAPALTRLGKRLAWFGNYDPRQSIGLYATDGTTIDFAYGELGVPAYTMELGLAFFESCAEAEANTFPQNLAAITYAARTLHAPYRLPAGPDLIDARVEPDLVAADEVLVLRATADDSRYRLPGSESPSHAIAGVQAWLGGLPWAGGSALASFSASDGSFNAPSEAVQASVAGSSLPATGRQLVYLQATDAAGELGPPTAVFVDVRPPDQLATVTGTVRDAVTGAPIAAAIATDTGWAAQADAFGQYARRLPAGPHALTASAAAYLPETRALAVTGGSDIPLDIDLLPRCELFRDDAESGNAEGWTVQAPWAIAAVAENPGLAWTDSPFGNYANSANVAITSRPLAAGGYEDLRLRFRHRCNTQGNVDFGLVEFSQGGGSWVEAMRCTGNLPWQTSEVAVPADLVGDDLRLRFRLVTSVSTTRDGWSIDDIVLDGGGQACRVIHDTLFADDFEGP